MNTNKKVLALKYRPQTFKDLIGQDVVAETISNSIKAKKVPNAYLFTGIRGVGKTTIARLVARALNCINGIESVCKESLCKNCEAISNSNHIDVLEMDAASKTGVDDVRDLIEFSRYGPTSAKYKIFIIDEVHMLSKQAFNALLKTLEEPPEYLKFVFATTEIKKIPITVVSRCQRFDLPRVKSLELFNFIKKITEKEKGKATDDALKLIVKISEGSVRDALSLLDRALISLEKDVELDLSTAQKIFGYFDKSNLIELFRYIFEGNEKQTLKIYRSIYDQGVAPKIFLNDFLELLYYFKNILFLKVDGTNFSLNDEEFNNIKKISKDISNETLLLFWQFTIKTLEEIDIVSNQNLSIEMFLIRLIYLKEISNLTDLISESENITEVIKNQTIEKNLSNNQNLKNDLLESKPYVDIILGPDSYRKLTQVISDRQPLKNHLVDTKLSKYEIYDDMFLKKYTAALIKRQWGENLKKFEGVQLPGGVTLNGKTIYDEAVDEINKIEEEMNLKWELPPDGFIA